MGVCVCVCVCVCTWPSWCHCHSLPLASVKFSKTVPVYGLLLLCCACWWSGRQMRRFGMNLCRMFTVELRQMTSSAIRLLTEYDWPWMPSSRSPLWCCSPSSSGFYTSLCKSPWTSHVTSVGLAYWLCWVRRCTGCTVGGIRTWMQA